MCVTGRTPGTHAIVTTLDCDWPFRFVVDSAGRGIGWVVINSHIVSASRQRQFAELRHAGFRFVGMSSDGAFPGDGEDSSLDYAAICEAWCHCFREPDRFVPRALPKSLLSESDFTDYACVSPERVTAAEGGGAFDFVYVGAEAPWKRESKGWELAMRCLPKLCGDLGLRGLLVGASATDAPRIPNLTCQATLPWHELLSRLARARFLFLPNECDASPRVIAEALCLSTPVVVNRRLLGGWKYVNAFTGVFFDDEHDVEAAVARCISAPRSPRRWFAANHGPYLAGRRLLRLLRPLDGRITERSHLGLAGSIVRPAPTTR